MDLGALTGTLLGTLVGAFAGAFLGYQFLRVENERIRELEIGERNIDTLLEKALGWVNEAAGALNRDEIAYRIRDAPDIVRIMKRLDLSPQELAAVDKLADVMPTLLAEIADARTVDERRPLIDRAMETVADRIAVLRRGLRERTRPRVWPFWPLGSRRSRQ